MNANAKRVGIAAGLVAAASFAVCATFVAIAPGSTTAFFSYMMHIDLSTMARTITWQSFVVGMLLFSVIVGAHVWLVAALYSALKSRAA